MMIISQRAILYPIKIPVASFKVVGPGCSREFQNNIGYCHCAYLLPKMYKYVPVDEDSTHFGHRAWR